MKARLKTDIGQHFLIDENVMDKMLETIPISDVIIEIGAGSGLLTQYLIQKANKVIAIEIDEKFKNKLEAIGNSNFEVVIGNALELLRSNNFKKITNNKKNVWVVGNIPYHITEPLMMSLVNLPISGATFLTGARFANTITPRIDNESLSKLTLLTNTFFNIEVIDFVDKSSFEPQPRTTSAIIHLKKKNEQEILENEQIYLFSKIFLSAQKGTLIKNIFIEAIISFNEYKKIGETKQNKKPLMTKNQAREKIFSLKIPETILNKSVEQLNNEEFKLLSDKLNKFRV